jgi:hypothetical protein
MPFWGAKLRTMPALFSSAQGLVKRWGRRGRDWSYPFSSHVPLGRCGMLAAFVVGTACLTSGFFAMVSNGRAASLDGAAIEVVNASQPALCAESDNVTINLTSNEVKQFRIEAAHPAYLATLKSDTVEADWTACDGLSEAARTHPQPPHRTTIYEEIELWVVGLTFRNFWRPASTTFRVGDRVEKGLHLIQIWLLRPMGGEEVLVLYPQDGYWRLRPLAPQGLAPTAFGSSFLIGPVEVEGRPFVKIKEIAFDPRERTFTLQFERGGSASVRMVKTDQNRHVLDVTFDRPIDGRPFAALRSMYVTDFNNDVARIAVREKDAQGWREEGILTFKRAIATDIWTGRLSPSRHNTSSPDTVFNAFSASAQTRGGTSSPAQK